MTESGLGGRGVLVTRPEHQAGKLAAAIESAGGRAIRFPVIDIRGRAAADIAADAAQLATPDIVVFVSANAVRFGLRLHRGEAEIAAIGPATAAAIEAAGGRVSLQPERGFDSEHLLAHPRLQDVRGSTVRVVRGGPGRELLGNTLRARGASVDYLSVYERRRSRPDRRQTEALERCWAAGEIDFVIVMSVESWTYLLALLPPGCRNRLAATPLVTPSNRVIQTATEQIPGIPAILAPGPDPDAMIRAMTSRPLPDDRPDERHERKERPEVD